MNEKKIAKDIVRILRERDSLSAQEKLDLFIERTDLSEMMACYVLLGYRKFRPALCGRLVRAYPELNPVLPNFSGPRKPFGERQVEARDAGHIMRHALRLLAIPKDEFEEEAELPIDNLVKL